MHPQQFRDGQTTSEAPKEWYQRAKDGADRCHFVDHDEQTYYEGARRPHRYSQPHLLDVFYDCP